MLPDLARALASLDIAVCAGTAALVRVPSAILLAVRQQWHSVRNVLMLKCRSTSRRSMDNDAAACDTGKGMTAECALPCASPVPARARRAPSRVRPRA
jgi:hypothetical protein